MPLVPEVWNSLRRFSPLVFDPAAEAGLLFRRETKYLVPPSMLPALLAGLCADYQLLVVNDRPVQRYVNFYWDTRDFRCYRAHHNGRRPRYKIRLRHYLETRMACWEIKKKVAPYLTEKYRQAVGEGDWRDFFRSYLPDAFAGLRPVLENRYRRISLLDREGGQRLTLDWDISGRIPGTGRWVGFPVVVAEHKQPPHSHRYQSFESIFRQLGLRSSPFSKYCLTCCRLYPGLKYNAFKPLLKTMEKMQHL